MLLQNINSILKEKARTSVFVAHRLRTIYDSDKIIVLRGGQVAESGAHSALLKKDGLYSELWNGIPDYFPRIPHFMLTFGNIAQETLMADGDLTPAENL